MNMTENKLWKIIEEEFVSYYGGYAYLISNGDCMFHVWERKEDAQKVCDMLNEMSTENRQLERYKDIIRACVENERTDLGHNVLVQLAENLGLEL